MEPGHPVLPFGITSCLNLNGPMILFEIQVLEQFQNLLQRHILQVKSAYPSVWSPTTTNDVSHPFLCEREKINCHETGSGTSSYSIVSYCKNSATRRSCNETNGYFFETNGYFFCDKSNTCIPEGKIITFNEIIMFLSKWAPQYRYWQMQFFWFQRE